MERKGVGSTVTVKTEAVEGALTKTRTLTSEENQVIRMRTGARVGLREPLARAAEGNTELADELTLIEMQLLRSFRARGVGSRSPDESPTKSKIVQALKRKR